MLDTRVRVRPCSDLLTRSSSRRDTSSSPLSARAMVIGSATWCCRVPLGPFTCTCWPSSVISTPDGTGIGSLPMRDMCVPLSYSSLLDVGEDFSAYGVSVGLSVGQQTARGGDDRDAHATQELGQPGRL